MWDGINWKKGGKYFADKLTDKMNYRNRIFFTLQMHSLKKYFYPKVTTRG
jgi:hypothetical protein